MGGIPVVSPTVHKHLLGAVVAAFLGLLAPVPAQAASAPQVKAAYPSDSDRDGHVDGVSITWSKPVRGGRDIRAPFAFRVAGYRVTSVGAATGKGQRVRVAERKECDAGGSVRVTYRPGGTALPVNVRGGTVVRRSRVDMRRFDPPIPRITCAMTMDADRDARVDGVRLTYSRAVRNRAQTSGKFVFSVSGYRVQRVRAARGRFLEVRVAEKGPHDSSAKPAVTYSRPSSAKRRPFAVRSGRRGDAFSGSFQGTRDGVAPALLSARTGDADRDGQLDAMSLRFSEPVSQTAPDAISVFGMQITSVTANGTDQLALSLAEGGASTEARPGTWVVGDGIKDGSGNTVLPGAVTPDDGAAPVMLAALTQDLGGAPGTIDTIVVGFSETVGHPRDGGGSYPFAVGGHKVSLVEPAAGHVVPIKMVEASSPNSGDTPSVRLTSGSGLPIADAAGNTAAEGFVNAIDWIAPVLLSASTADDDADGRIDRARFLFSEPVLHESEPAAPSFTVAGYTALDAAGANGAEVGVSLSEGAGTDSGATPGVSYTNDGVKDVRDAAGNETPDSSLAAAIDGAVPVLLSARTADADDDGRIDGVQTTWSEPLAHADDSAAPFPVSTSQYSVTRVRAADGANLTVDVSEPSQSDTGTTPTLTYSGGADPIRDQGGLEPAKRSWPGVTQDALAPRVISATTGDDDQDGILDSIDVRFSENVEHPQENAPASFTVVGQTVTSAEAASTDAIELKLQEAGLGNSGLTPSVGYTPDGVADVRDAAANLGPAATIPQAADGAKPVLKSAATVDTNSNGRLDRVTTGWSEPLVHADDSAGPFPLSVEQLAVARVHPAAGQTLDIDLTEPGAADTGSAPDLTYDSGADPIRDAAGLEPAQRSYPGLTRDALPPRLVSTGTGDADDDGKLDTIDIEWSEQVTGSTPTAPFTVTGRTLGANVTFSGARTRVPFTEDLAQFDTHDTPQVSYDAGPGDLRDIPEGDGDTAEDTPGVALQTPLDKAPPILVAAKTADLSTPAGGAVPNGTIDAMLVTFSEPISHAVDGIAPFSLNVAGRNETDVEADTGATDRTLYVKVGESGSPDGGEKPNVSVQAAGPLADRIKDRAATPNEARVMTFSGTTDEVRPVLMSTQLGESEGGSCTKAAQDGIDGEVDCVLATWSEDVEHADDPAPNAPFSVSSSHWTVPSIGQLAAAETLSIPLTETTTKDRDRSGTTVSYDDAIDTPILDPAGNESLSGTKPAEPACRDTGLEVTSDARDDGNPVLTTTSPSFQRKCAFDDDWYKVMTSGEGFLDILTRPAAGVDVQFDLFDENGVLVPAPPPTETGGPGQIDRIEYLGLNASDPYFVRVSATDTPSPQEGPYCVVFSDSSGADPGCGPLVGQLVFTEVGVGADKFAEIKNDFDIPVDMNGAGAKLVLGPANAPRGQCQLELPTDPANHTIEPEEHVIVQATASADRFGCLDIVGNVVTAQRTVLPSISSTGERLALDASGAIDVVDFTGLIDSAVARDHSLQFVPDALTEDATWNDQVDIAWCRTFAADTKGATGDGCDEYRINEVLWRPALTSGLSDGKAFVEIGGNIPALPNSKLLGGWVVRGVNGLTGDGSYDFVLPVAASPRNNGTYVVADGVAGATTVADYDTIWDGLDLNSPLWPDATGIPGPRGLQLLMPDPPGAPPCNNSADAFGWTTTAQGFTKPLDDLRSCPGRESQEYTNSTVGASAARDNLSNAGDTSYNEARDTQNNRDDFCPQAVPNPGQLNIRPAC